MFCSKCGKTLKPDAQVCQCGQPVGESRFEGVPYTSVQAKIAPDGASHTVGDALPYTRTTYTGMDEKMQAGADADARTTYRPVYEGSSVPGDIRQDVRSAVGHEDEMPEDMQYAEEHPLVREIFDEAQEGGMDDFGLSQLRSRPIVSEGRAGISRDVEEYVEKLEAVAGKSSRRARRTRIYGGDEQVRGDQAYENYEEVGEEVFADNYEDAEEGGFMSRNTMRMVVRIVGVLAGLAILAVGGKLIYDRVNQITDSSPISGVSSAVYEDGIMLIGEHADQEYVDTLLTRSETEGLLAVTSTLEADAAAIQALLPDEENRSANDELFVNALASIQENIGVAVTMDVIAMGTQDASSTADSNERWKTVNDSITQLTVAKTPEELTAITNGVTLVLNTPTAEPVVTPVPYTTLARGDSGDEVLALQNRLWELGYMDSDRDGAFGSKTQTAVKYFQEAVGLEQTGIADSTTQELLYADDAPRTSNAQPTTAATITTAPTQEPASEPTLDAELDLLLPEDT